MNHISIELSEGKRGYRPMEKVEGRVTWSLDRTSYKLTISLLWRSSGRGIEDAMIEDQVEVEHPGRSGDHPFSFQLPLSPYSFSGQLISLTWLIEAILDDVGTSEREEIVVSPNGEVIVLRDLP